MTIADSISWHDAFPEIKEGKEPEYSIALRGARQKEDMTQAQLAEATGIPQGHISAMEIGKLTIGKRRAKRLSEVLNIDYRVFL